MVLFGMGMEDRDWYREKEIDWERGGLRERRPKRRPRLLQYLWLLVLAALIIAALWFRLS